MFKSTIYIILVSVMMCTACSASKNELTLAQQSFVRWHAEENMLEVYAVAVNQTKADISFEASIVLLNPNLRDAVGFDTVEIKEDDRNGKPPFHLKSYNETVFKQTFKTNRTLTREMLSNGVGIKISTQEKSYTLPIKYGERGKE
ncbi:hypothetical protein Back11_50900 [Paenibacillus baekrokdamisoli]|uniref:Uncharacterized protein n=1 Tax=Paenibacillus baekrokdamisoli TaxID=1712516 RepID=A0A3G9J630_9BACL|nr:hypothetical protein [Paenibacillus baekrokdamisoli]MBB3068922.1 hypothetical protein [Paenibacillus baekrokdamisoli]BBH23745.1 hypothetical protein Back11_50900 [Paenibacillus baekrokdamisoli]